MKTLIPNFLEGIVVLFGAFSNSRGSFFTREPFINEDFFEQFDNEEDKELLNKTVADLKISQNKSREIILTNNKKVKIVVD